MAKKKPVSEESAEEKQQEAEEKKRCFIITPVGDINSEIRRAADGLIDAVIEPVLDELKFTVITPHRDYHPVSITGRIIKDVIESELVIANLTSLNPNVMYELAVRHAIAKPIVVIADRSTQLPFDIKDVQTIFFDNDMQGVVELHKTLKEAVQKSIESPKIDNPIVRYKDRALIELSGDPKDPLRLILDRLDSMDKASGNTRARVQSRARVALIALGPGIADESKQLFGFIESYLSSFDIDLEQINIGGKEDAVEFWLLPNPALTDSGIHYALMGALDHCGIEYREIKDGVPF